MIAFYISAWVWELLSKSVSFQGKELYNLPVEERAFVVLEEDGTEVDQFLSTS